MTTPQTTQGKRALRAIESANKHYGQWTDVWQDIYDYVFPMRRPFWDHSEGQEHNEQIFDETAVVETPRFASRLVNGTFPFGARAFSLEPGPDFPSEIAESFGWREVENRLKAVGDHMHDALRVSNFHDQLHEGCLDLAIGTMNQEVMPGRFPGDLVFDSSPLTHVMLIPGPDGYPSGWVRKRETQQGNILKVYPGAVLPESVSVRGDQDEMQMRRLTEVVLARRDVPIPDVYERTVMLAGVGPSPGALGMGGDSILEETFSGIGSSPWITNRWSSESGEVYGRGPLVQALPAIRTLNLTMRLVLQNAQMSIGGVYTYDDDGVFNFENVVIEPGTFIPRIPGSTIDPLINNSRFDVSQLVLQEMRQNVRAALFSPQPDRPQGRTPPTATEVADDRAEIAVNMGSAVSRFSSEYVQRLIQRIAFIWKQQGILSDLPRIDGRQIRMVAESPLLRFQRDQDIADYLRYIQSLGLALGPETAILAQKAGATKDYLARLHGIPGQVQVSGEELEERAIQTANAAAQAAGIGQGQPQLPQLPGAA